MPKYLARTCVSCGQIRNHYGRGLCSTCYTRHRIDGTLDDYSRSTRSAEEVLEEWEFLSDLGIERAAERLGMTVVALERALNRARRRGDPRAA